MSVRETSLQRPFEFSVPAYSNAPSRVHALTLAVVLTAHAAVLAGALLMGPTPSLPVTPPIVQGVLVSESLPAPAPVRPAESVRPPQATPPVPALPSERAPQLAPAPPREHLPEPAPAETVAPIPAPAADMTAANEGEVTPPRSDAAHLNNPRPAYPAVSRRLREEGRVVLEVLILEDGLVGDLRLKSSSGFDRLDKAALAAVRRWKYVPAQRDGRPIALWYTQSLHFSLVR